MSTIIAKNLTGADVPLSQLIAIDAKVPGSGQVELTLYNTVTEILEDSELLAYIQSDTLILNDGISDLTKEQSLNRFDFFGGIAQHIYDAIIDVSGGDYTKPSDAFAAGKKNVYIRSGTYVESADIVIPSGGCLVGASPGKVILVLGTFSVKIDGSARQINTGTISIANGTNAVTGIGTTFTTLQVGDFIRIDEVWHSIASISDNTNLTLDNKYNGQSVSSLSFVGQSMHVGGCLKNLLLVNGSSHGLYIKQTLHLGLSDILVGNTGNLGLAKPSIYIQESSENYLKSVVVEGSLDDGILLKDSNNLYITSSACKGSRGNGLTVDNSNDLVFDGCYLLQNNKSGLDVINGSIRISITDSIIRHNKGKGVNTDGGTSSCIIDSCTIEHNGGDGVDFDGEQNIVSSSIIKNNDGHGIQAGDDGTITGCQVEGNSQHGINLNSDECTTVSGNIISANDNGVDIPNGAYDNIIADNSIINNLGKGIVCNGDTNNVRGNLIRGNGEQGILVTGDNNVIGDNISRSNTGKNVEVTSSSSNCRLDAPRWQKYTKIYSDFTDAATDKNIELFALTPGSIIHAIKIKHSSSFSGGAISAYTVSIGISGDLTKYSSAFDIKQSPSNTTQQLSSIIGTEDHGAITSIRINANSTGANLDQATQGSVSIWVLVSETP